MAFVDPSPRTLESSSTRVLLVNAQKQLLISLWLQALSAFSNTGWFLSKCSFSLPHPFNLWDSLFPSLKCQSPNWCKSYTFLHPTTNVDFYAPNKETHTMQIGDTYLLTKSYWKMIWKHLEFLMKHSKKLRNTQIKFTLYKSFIGQKLLGK